MSESRNTIALKLRPILGLFVPQWEITGEIKSGSMVLGRRGGEMRRRTLTFTDFLFLFTKHITRLLLFTLSELTCDFFSKSFIAKGKPLAWPEGVMGSFSPLKPRDPTIQLNLWSKW